MKTGSRRVVVNVGKVKEPNATVVRALTGGLDAGTRVHIEVHRKDPPVGYVEGYGFSGTLHHPNGKKIKSHFSFGTFKFDDPSITPAPAPPTPPGYDDALKKAFS